MKPINFFYGIFALLITVLFISCSSGSGSLIIGKWKLTELKSPDIDNMKSSSEATMKMLDDSIAATTDTAKIRVHTMHKDETKAMMDMLNQRMDEMKNNSFMEFKKDGTYEASMGGGNEKGKWEIDGSGKYLISQTDGQGKKDTINISELTPEKLVLSKDSTSMIFAPATAETK